MPNNAQNHNFMGRKPSKAQVLNQAKRLEKLGADFVALTWGENWIDLTLSEAGYWYGSGWLKDIDGDWVARELNHYPSKALAKQFNDPVKFLRDHLTVIHIG